MLQELTEKRHASLVVIKGRRRIGKTRLIQEFCKRFKTLRFVGLTPEKSDWTLGIGFFQFGLCLFVLMESQMS